ncbi:MAG: HIT family protein [Desulfococcaceae bacterium]|jgi:histidine triad (HIT) family protein|nr:HIT family protein [Desulfococcaceae bacterium]
MDDCIFCKIVKGEIPSFKVYEDEQVYAFADINPINKGHTLIIPKNHAENIWEMSEEDMQAVHRAAKKVAHAIQEALQPQGIACAQLNGKAVNQVVMHYHYHLIPKSADEPEMTMTHWELKPGDMDQIKEISEKIAAALS